MNTQSERRGHLYHKSDIDAFRDLRKVHHIQGFKDEHEDEHGIRHSEAFDAHLIAQLLSVKGCTGLRVAYGAAPEDNYKINIRNGKKVMPRLLLIPVDDDGNELTFNVIVEGSKDGGDDFGGVAGGKPCPPASGCPQ